jgi:release factor glutamine methyltransferase
MLKASALLGSARRRLARAVSPALDARLLLQAAAGLRTDELIAEPDLSVSPGVARLYESYVERRAGGEPVSRILGVRAFCGVELTVTPAVLDPRPETEHLVEEVLLSGEGLTRFLDLGTGSGAIAIAVAQALPTVEVVAVDVSAAALLVAKANAQRLGVGARIAFQQSDWFSEVTGRFDIIASNPPYIASDDIANLALDVKGHDPHLALDGGRDGLSCYRAIAQSAAEHLNHGGRVIVEIGHDQLESASAVFAAHGFQRIKAYRDYAGLDRGLVFVRA